ncbi:hypothetical protein M758_4G188900 [Ceratodon purpureus]|nr:hypothetical protein M758_4G188900 [Ceratodon purpureus]
MVSYRRLLAAVEAALLTPRPAPHHRADLSHALHVCLPDLQQFLTYPTPKAEDRAQVASKEVKLPNSAPTIIDNQDAQIALKLSEDYNLNEVHCVGLLVSAHQEWNLLGREPVEILRLSAGLWFTERRALITSLQLLLRAVVLDDELDSDLVADIRLYIERLLDGGLRARLIALIKELNREEPAGLGGPGVEPYVMDSRGALVQRRNVIQKERLSLCHCLVLTCLIVRISAQEAKDLFNLLKDCASDESLSQDVVKLQITYTIMFALTNSLTSDALGGSQEMGSSLALNAGFRKEFQHLIMDTSELSATAEGFTGVIRFVWAVYLMITRGSSEYNTSGSFTEDEIFSRSCLTRACEHDVFEFITTRVLQTATFQNDDEDLVFMYNAYLHKLMTSFLSQPAGREKIKEMKDAAMMAMDPYVVDIKDTMADVDSRAQQQAVELQAKPFISLLNLIGEIYQREPELIVENEDLWNFVRFAGEDHNTYRTLVAFLNMLTALAASEEGAKEVYQLLQNKAIRTLGWQTLFNSLVVYDQRFRQCLQTAGSFLPPLQEGDARALEAYLKVLRRVMEKGNEMERSQWFLDIEPLFKLLSYENVPPYLKGALRNAIATFVPVSPVMKNKVWSLLEQYDLPVVATPLLNDGGMSSQVYDMTFELNEVEARQEEYPSTLSYLKLLNVLIEQESDAPDKGGRFIGIFRFVRDQAFAPYAQRAYANTVEKWELVVAALRHFELMLSTYQITDDDVKNSADHLLPPENSLPGMAAPGLPGVSNRLPIIELMKDLMSGKVIYRNVMSILMMGVNSVIEQRTSQLYGPALEEAISLCLQILHLALSKDNLFAEAWRPVYQPIDIILSHDIRQIVTVLEFVRYDSSPLVQRSSVLIMKLLSARMPQLVSIILEAGAASNLIEDYAACLETRAEDSQATENPDEDTGSLILRLLLANLDQPAPNVTHLLLKFDVNQLVERTMLQPKRHFSCLRVILDMLDTLARPEVNAGLHELGFQLMYELCVDPITCGPVVELLRGEKYEFFSKHLDTFVCEPLPKRSTNQQLRVSSLQQRAWLLKLVALELHLGDMDVVVHRDSCRRLLSRLFLREPPGWETGMPSNLMPARMTITTTDFNIHKVKVLELLEILQFQLPEAHSEFPPELHALKEELKVDEILGSPATVDQGGVYHISERGDRLIDLSAFRDLLWQEYKRLEVQYNLLVNGQKQSELREALQQLLRWAWKRNKNLEEQAAQLHMLVGWSQLVEIAISRRFHFLGSRTHVLFEILDASISATISQDCSLRMAFLLSQVALTTMAKLQEQSIVSPGEGDSTDDVTYLDVLSTVRLSNSACHTILSKLLASILRSESSEGLRRRQYATLLSYFHYCQGMVNRDLPLSVMRALLVEGRDGEEDMEIEKLDRDQAELAQLNFSLLKRDATALVDVVSRDATNGSEVGKSMAYYVLDALLAVDHHQVFLSQLQSRGLLHSCLAEISSNSYQAILLPSAESMRRLYTLESELALLLRVGYHNRKRGAQTLYAMGALRHLSSCRAIDAHLTDDAKWEQVKIGVGMPSQHDRQHQLVSPVLRLVLCFTALIDTTEATDGGRDEVALEVLEFIKSHQGLLDRILRDDTPGVHLADLDELQLATAILSKVWPVEESPEFGYTQAMFNLAYVYFCPDAESRSRFVQHIREAEKLSESSGAARETIRKMELQVARVRCNLIAYLYALVTKHSLRLHIFKPDIGDSATMGPYNLGRQRQPTLKLVADLLQQASLDLESALEEKALLLARLQDVNELSRHEVDEIIKAYGRQENSDPSDSIRKRRYVAMVEMCSAAGSRECQVSSLLFLVEHALEILYLHFEKLTESKSRQGRFEINLETNWGRKEDIQFITGKLLPVFERLESLNEDRVGRSMKHLQRLVHSLKSKIMMGSSESYLT